MLFRRESLYSFIAYEPTFVLEIHSNRASFVPSPGKESNAIRIKE